MAEPRLEVSDNASVRVPEALAVGRGWIDHLATGLTPSRARLLKAHFEPGFRTSWHRHENGQILHVTDGVLVVQERARPAVILRPGETIVCTPGAWHWHGSDADHFLSLISVVELDDDGQDAVWGDPVSEQDYRTAIGGS